MAHEYPTLLDVAKTDKGSGFDVIDETIHSHEELTVFPAATQEGTRVDFTVITDLPGGNTFRIANEGIESTKTGLGTKSFDMALANRLVEIDKHGVYEKAKDKARTLVLQSVPQMNKVLSDVAVQAWYGLDADPNKGFPGLIKQMSQAATHNYDVTGAAAKSSVFMIEVTPSVLDLAFGNDQTLTMGDDWKEYKITLPDGKRLTVLGNEIAGWVGLRLYQVNRCVRIKNIGTANGKTLTDAHLYAGLNLCEDLGFKPTHIFGNPRSFEQVRASRTATSPSGAPAPRLDNWEGIQIVRSINISKAETI